MKNLLRKCFFVPILALLLTGCTYVNIDMNISEDGNIVMTSSSGFTEKGVEMLNSLSEEEQDLSDYTIIEENGIKYYIQSETQEFDISEYAEKTSTDDDEDNSSSKTELYKNDDGSIVFKFIATQETSNTTSTEESLKSVNPDLSEEEMAEMLEGMTARWNITFPYPVVQTSGHSEGVYIDGNKLTLNLMEFNKLQSEETEEYMFISSQSNETTICKFVDVPSEEWYYNAVNALSKGGLVSGMTEDTFGPNLNLTVGQFCTILSKAKNLELGELNGHWSGLAVQNCIDAGYIVPGAELTEKYYDRAITREEAISAMYLAKADSFNEPTQEISIPDYEEISSIYKDNIINAYKYGITSGMDEAHTFSPKSYLTRAQICQLFYNLNWTSVEE